MKSRKTPTRKALCPPAAYPSYLPGPGCTPPLNPSGLAILALLSSSKLPDLFLLHGHLNKRPLSSGTLSLDPGTLFHPTQPPLPLADSLFFSSLLGHGFFSGTLVALTFLGCHGTSLRLPYIQQLYHTSWFKPLFPNRL